MLAIVLIRTTNELNFKYLDADGKELESSSLAITNSTNAAIAQMFNPWENNADKDLDILGVQVFMEELVVNPNKYSNNINDALHDAISLARIFLTEINLQQCSAGSKCMECTKTHR